MKESLLSMLSNWPFIHIAKKLISLMSLVYNELVLSTCGEALNLINKQNILISSFFLSCLALMALSIRLENLVSNTDDLKSAKNERRKVPSIFHNVHYYLLSDGQNQLLLVGDKLMHFEGTGEVNVEKPRGKIFPPENAAVSYSGDSGKFNSAEQVINLYGDVHLKTELEDVQSSRGTFFAKQNKFIVEGEVKTKKISPKTGDLIFIDADKAQGYSTKKIGKYTGNVKGKIVRAKPYEPPVYFSSHSLNVDMVQNVIYLEGNVNLIKQQFSGVGMKAEIFLENYNKKLKYYVLYDDVRLTEKVTLKNGRQINRIAYAEKLEGYVREKRVLLTGNPRVIQEKDVIRGNVITLLENSEVIEVSNSDSSFMIKKD
ncbi:MAG: LPS export ABC transporter periplasmic protein LptC [Bacteriovoracaceae bacterium]|nr:LPS export ABC transporter periplasmic protein LptC [Bacteriovoracaceae bacterium]